MYLGSFKRPKKIKENFEEKKKESGKRSLFGETRNGYG